MIHVYTNLILTNLPANCHASNTKWKQMATTHPNWSNTEATLRSQKISSGPWVPLYPNQLIHRSFSFPRNPPPGTSKIPAIHQPFINNQLVLLLTNHQCPAIAIINSTMNQRNQLQRYGNSARNLSQAPLPRASSLAENLSNASSKASQSISTRASRGMTCVRPCLGSRCWIVPWRLSYVKPYVVPMWTVGELIASRLSIAYLTLLKIELDHWHITISLVHGRRSRWTYCINTDLPKQILANAQIYVIDLGIQHQPNQRFNSSD